MARAFRRRATPSSAEGRIEAAAIQAARRRGMTNREIAERFGINERTIRKIISGETSGKRLYREKVPKTDRLPSSPNVFRADVRIGTDEDGFEVVRSVNVKLPDVPGPKGRRAPNFFDILRLPDLQSVAEREAKAMEVGSDSVRDLRFTREPISIVSLRPIFQRNPKTILHTIKGTYGAA